MSWTDEDLFNVESLLDELKRVKQERDLALYDRFNLEAYTQILKDEIDVLTERNKELFDELQKPCDNCACG